MKDVGLQGNRMSVKFARVTQPLQYYWKQYPALAWVLPLLWLLAIAAVTLVWHVSSIGLIDETEPLFVEASRQMVVTGDWVTPYVNGEPRFDKPPLIYWLMVFAFQSFGVNEFAARLPSILAAVAIALFCFYTLQQYGDLGVGSRENSKLKTRNSKLKTPFLLLLTPACLSRCHDAHPQPQHLLLGADWLCRYAAECVHW